MKKFNYLVILGLVFGFLFVTSCKKDEDDPKPTINESEVLATFLESADSPYGKDYVNTDMATIMPAADVRNMQLTNQAYIIDIRAAADYANGHIDGAVNVPLGQILSHVQGINHTSYERVVVVCYAGQSSGYAVTILRLMGIKNAFSMGFGMSSWNAAFSASWSTKLSNLYATQFTSEVTSKGPTGNMPVLNTGKTTGMEILEARMATILSEGFQPCQITAETVFANLGNYYIVNYWPENQYLDPGHIPGAMQYTPKLSLKLTEDLKTLPTDKPIVVYCYTGQGSAFLSAYLRLLGYDSRSLMYGASAMIIDELAARGMARFSMGAVQDFPYITSK